MGVSAAQQIESLTPALGVMGVDADGSAESPQVLSISINFEDTLEVGVRISADSTV